jgi:hypothetical protein
MPPERMAEVSSDTEEGTDISESAGLWSKKLTTGLCWRALDEFIPQQLAIHSTIAVMNFCAKPDRIWRGNNTN